MTTPTTAELPVQICSCVEYWPGDGHAPDCPVLREILDARATIARLERENANLTAFRDGVASINVCGGTGTPESHREMGQFAGLLKKLAEQQQRADAAERRVEDMIPLARLGEWTLERIRGVYAGDVDAFDVQDKATAFGVIAPQSAPKPCGECCVCEEMDADTCYRDTDATTRARAALTAASGAADGAATTLPVCSECHGDGYITVAVCCGHGHGGECCLDPEPSQEPCPTCKPITNRTTEG